ncbi:uncharacterized protein LOC34619457 [Cyclospora cayetanensis]|uniref:Uncharacterized protein LOC34619457 n=1 Tax=Cyclospora cayetanensis TaxID=88456 RepID=A0A6P6RVL4_9EIME|nr:uncharacterized protein LOC34619457 [Cyclospora cayetanensis]
MEAAGELQAALQFVEAISGGAAAAANTSSSGSSTDCGNGSSHTAFYQAADGQPVFLHPFYYQLLLHEAGGELSRLPPVLLNVPLLSLRGVQQQHQRQQRAQQRPLKLVEHLPKNTSAKLAEVNIDAWLSSETLQHFEADLRRREQQRKQQRQRQQQGEAAAARRAAAAAAAAAPPAAMAEEQQAPEDLSAFPSLPGVTTPVARATAGATRGTTTAPENAASAGGGLSFAGVVAFPADFREATLEQRQQLHFPSLATAVSVAVVGPKPRRARAGAAGDGGNAKSSTSSRKKSGVYKVASLGEFLGATRASQNPTL